MSTNVNLTSSFILLGFSDFPFYSVALFSVILVIYSLTWIGNLLLLISIYLSPKLHTPMYFFLGNLSVVDVFFSTMTVPKLLSSILHGMTVISFFSCFLQMFLFFTLGTVEMYLLAVMAFDRYLAICNPLRYVSVMSRKVRVTLTVMCWVVGSLHSFLYTYPVSQLKFCGDRIIPHFFCDFTSLMKISCSSFSDIVLLMHTEGPMVVCIPFLLILISYMLIARAITKMKTTSSRSKAFSSCSSHLMVVCLFYVSIIFIYFRACSNCSSQYDRLVNLGYCMVTPMLNPFIYSLRNQDVRNTLKRFTIQSSFSRPSY
ncbi:olfactory receptor 1f45-like [Gastrophryne carolinensis]